MTFNIKKLLLADSNILSWLYLKPIILKTKVCEKHIDIEFELKYNIIGNIFINPLQTILEVIWYGLSEFDWYNITHRGDHKIYYGIKKSYFTDKEVKWLSTLPIFGASVKPNLDNCIFNIDKKDKV